MTSLEPTRCRQCVDGAGMDVPARPGAAKVHRDSCCPGSRNDVLDVVGVGLGRVPPAMGEHDEGVQGYVSRFVAVGRHQQAGGHLAVHVE